MQITSTEKSYKKYIDIESELRGRGGSLSKMPKWIIRILERIICQKKMNDYLNQFEGLEDNDFLEAVLKEFKIKLDIEGRENLPESGRCFFVSNHPFGIVDGLILTWLVCSKYKDFKSVGNDAFLLLPNLSPHIAKVNVYGKSSREEITKLNEIYNSDVPITHFPAGEVSRIYHGKICDSLWQKSFIGKSFSCKRDIVPFHVYGRNSILFYTIFILRKLFFIKLNIELILLPHEMLNKRNKKIRVKILKPIPWHMMEKVSHYEAAQKVRKYIYNETDFAISD
jgi:putative hemolysin